VDALCELKTRKVLALAMATTEQIELDKHRERFKSENSIKIESMERV
jgi:hypothetical protein